MSNDVATRLTPASRPANQSLTARQESSHRRSAGARECGYSTYGTSGYLAGYFLG